MISIFILTMIGKLIIVALVATLAFETIPSIWSTYWIRMQEWRESREFVKDERHLLGKYPTFMGDVFEGRIKFVNSGTWMPSLNAAWTASWITQTIVSIARWVGNNFLARMLSPQTLQEYIGLVIMSGLIIWCGSNLMASRWLADTMSRNRDVKMMNKLLRRSKPTVTDITEKLTRA